MNVHSIPPKVLVARHNQLLRFKSNGQPLERSQVPHISLSRCGLSFDPTCSTLTAMADRPTPVFRTIEEVSLIGTMAIYDSQAEASQGIPQQWRAFRLAHPALESSSKFYGASPCTGDRKIHYLTGVAYEGPDGVV